MKLLMFNLNQYFIIHIFYVVLSIILCLSIPVILFNPLPVLPAPYTANPFIIGKIPVYSKFTTFFKIILLFPAKFTLDFIAIYRITPVMSRPVFNILYQALKIILLFPAASAPSFHRVVFMFYILPLVFTTDIICFTIPPFVHNSPYSVIVVINIEPVTVFLPSPYTGSFLPSRIFIIITGISFSCELVWAVVVRAVCHCHRETISVIICHYDMVRGSL